MEGLNLTVGRNVTEGVDLLVKKRDLNRNYILIPDFLIYLYILYIYKYIYIYYNPYTAHTDTTKDLFIFFTTWIKKDDSLESRVLVVVDLNVLERLHQLVQHSVGYPADLRLRTVPVDHAAIACGHQVCRSVGKK